MGALHGSAGVLVRRFETRVLPHIGDARERAVVREAHRLGVGTTGVRSSRVYLIESAIDTAQAKRLLEELLTDPARDSGIEGARQAEASDVVIEVHPLPGVMDPVARTVENAATELLGMPSESVRVSTGWRFDIAGATIEGALKLARQCLANGVIEHIHTEPWEPTSLPRGAPADQTVQHVPMRGMTDVELASLSMRGHLFLNLDEMRAIQRHFEQLQREPTDIELETIAQTWSEHCVHKTLKSSVLYTPPVDECIDWQGRPGCTVRADGAVMIDNLLRSTIAAATFELRDDGLDWALSVFVDNSGVIAFDEKYAVCMKVETHNRPSAIEPYGGAATGIGGCIRDIMGTGMGAQPIANTDVFCVAHPDSWNQSEDDHKELHNLPPGVLHPRRILTRVVDGVRDYGNRMGIPTVNGAVHFDDRYIGNPLVYCGCVGILPRDMVTGEPCPGDLIVALGGRTGKDGIHGATFSSGEVTSGHADEFSHAVQIGNAIEQKRVLDALLRARDAAGGPLYSAITDCGAGGFSSAVGEMGEKIGAEVNLERAPLKYDGLRYDEIWISESQERMVLAVPSEQLAALQQVCDEESVELAVLGSFGRTNEQGEPELMLRYDGTEVGRLSMPFLHNGLPMPMRIAMWRTQPPEQRDAIDAPIDIERTLLALLAHPDIASKRWIISQYDHEVQGNTVGKPLVGPAQEGPGDAAVIEPVPGSGRGLAIACGMATRLGHPDTHGADPYIMAMAAVDECVRNLVCVGADPTRIAILDNYCWPGCDDEYTMGALVRASVGCYDAAKAYRTPFISGKDSLNNQYRNRQTGELIEIPPTLLISGMGIVPNLHNRITSDMKAVDDSVLVLIRPCEWTSLGGSCAEAILRHGGVLPKAAPDAWARCAHAVHRMINSGNVCAAHDCSDGGILAAVAEMLIGAGETVGAEIDANVLSRSEPTAALFAEHPGNYLLQIKDIGRLEQLDGVECIVVGAILEMPELRVIGAGLGVTLDVSALRNAFLGTLDW